MSEGNSTHEQHTVLIIYATVHGSTAEIAEYIGNRMREKGLHVRVASATEDLDPELFEAVVLGSAVYNGALLPELARYIDRHGVALRVRPTWLFSVGVRPMLAGPVGVTDHPCVPRRVQQVRRELCALGFRQFDGVLDRPGRLVHRLRVRLMGRRYGDHRNWPQIDEWTDGIVHWIRVKLPATRFPTVREPHRTG